MIPYPVDLKARALVRSYLVARQGGVCRICRRPFSWEDRALWPQVDHDHKSGVVRGALCQQCNARVGRVESMNKTGLPEVHDYIRRNGDADDLNEEDLGPISGLALESPSPRNPMHNAREEDTATARTVRVTVSLPADLVELSANRRERLGEPLSPTVALLLRSYYEYGAHTHAKLCQDRGTGVPTDRGGLASLSTES